MNKNRGARAKRNGKAIFYGYKWCTLVFVARSYSQSPFLLFHSIPTRVGCLRRSWWQTIKTSLYNTSNNDFPSWHKFSKTRETVKQIRVLCEQITDWDSKVSPWTISINNLWPSTIRVTLNQRQPFQVNPFLFVFHLTLILVNGSQIVVILIQLLHLIHWKTQNIHKILVLAYLKKQRSKRLYWFY